MASECSISVESCPIVFILCHHRVLLCSLECQRLSAFEILWSDFQPENHPCQYFDHHWKHCDSILGCPMLGSVRDLKKFKLVSETKFCVLVFFTIKLEHKPCRKNWEQLSGAILRHPNLAADYFVTWFNRIPPAPSSRPRYPHNKRFCLRKWHSVHSVCSLRVLTLAKSGVKSLIPPQWKRVKFSEKHVFLLQHQVFYDGLWAS